MVLSSFLYWHDSASIALWILLLFHQTMLGDRYGYRPIPSFIPEQEFDLIIKEALVFDRQKVETVQSWYIKDSNALPPVYVLQVRSRYTMFCMYTTCARFFCVLYLVTTSILFSCKTIAGASYIAANIVADLWLR